MKYFRKLICYFFGHRSIMTWIEFFHRQDENLIEINYIINTCERCGYEK